MSDADDELRLSGGEQNYVHPTLAYRALATMLDGEIHQPSVARMVNIAGRLPEIVRPEYSNFSEHIVATLAERLGLCGDGMDKFYQNVCGGNKDLAAVLVFAGRHGVTSDDVARWQAEAAQGNTFQHEITPVLVRMTQFIKPEVMAALGVLAFVPARPADPSATPAPLPKPPTP